jgi:hypothetical protein
VPPLSRRNLHPHTPLEEAILGNELEPIFHVQVWFDGDDDAAIEFENFRRLLVVFLEGVRGTGSIRHWAFHREGEDGQEQHSQP